VAAFTLAQFTKAMIPATKRFVLILAFGFLLLYYTTRHFYDFFLIKTREVAYEGVRIIHLLIVGPTEMDGERWANGQQK
jgi:hypothetical protein